MPNKRFQTPDFSLRQLQYAVAVAERGGFGAAAEECGVSQPSLSAQVAKLEASLGVRLFDRGTRHLTSAGVRLLPVFRQVLAAGDAVALTAATMRDPYAIPVRIAVIPTIAPYLLPTAVELLAAPPRPLVHWIELQTRLAEEAVALGNADAMVIADAPQDVDLVTRSLGWEPLVAALPENVDSPASISLEWLEDRDVLLLEDGHCLRDHIVSLCRLRQTRESPFRATSLPTLVQMVSAGLGVSVLPAMAVPVECSRSHVVPRRFEGSFVGRSLRMAWRKGHPASVAIEEIANRLATAVHSVVADAERFTDSRWLSKT